jgi:hypothetical protein
MLTDLTAIYIGFGKLMLNGVVTTCQVHASELHVISGDAKEDAELVARLLNEHYNKLFAEV